MPTDTPTPIELSVAHCLDEIPTAPERRAHTTYIVVDVIRATTTLAVMFARGAHRVFVARDVDAARAAKPSLPGALLAGEVNAVAPADFDHGNSPDEWGHVDIAGRDILFSTTNGARGLHASRDGGPIFAGSLRNARAVSHAALAAARALASDGAPGSVLVVCSGRGGHPAEDDSLCAGWLIATLQRIAAEQETPITLGAGAPAALDLLATSEHERAGDAHWLYDTLAASEPARDVIEVGLSADLAWCAEVDATDVVPTVTGYDPDLGLLIVERQ